MVTPIDTDKSIWQSSTFYDGNTQQSTKKRDLPEPDKMCLKKYFNGKKTKSVS